jgi:2'-5' RNA ligase
LFLALWPDAAVRAGLESWSGALHDACGGRRIRAENLHLTLAFLGGVDEARVPAVEEAAGRVVPRSFSLVLDEPGYWKRNRLAWAGASAAPAALDTLVAELRAALRAAGVAFDPKPFVSHVTLLREARAPAKMPPLEAIHWPVGGFALVRSVTAPEGSRYEARRTWG